MVLQQRQLSGVLLCTDWRLNTRLAINAKVKRDGKWKNPRVTKLVQGDVVRLRLGDIVPSDARVLDGDSVEVDQSMTGLQRNERHAATRQPRKRLRRSPRFNEGTG